MSAQPTRINSLSLVLFGIVSLTLISCGREGAAPAESTIPIDADDIAGFVSSAAGPEAGVWVIAETADLGTRFARIVVTDDEDVEADLSITPDGEHLAYLRGHGDLWNVDPT